MKHPKKLITLDVLRGLACLLVWISHIRVATGYFADARYDFIQTFTAWGREAVVVFFLLSGIVINLSSQNKTGRAEYFKKRFIRIYPVYLAVFAICFLADHFIFGHPVDGRTVTGNLLLSSSLPAYIAPVMPLNAAVWSIGCEAFFYLVFGLIYTPQRLKGIWIWFGICGLSIVYKVIYSDYHTGLFYQLIYLLNSSFLWILGYLIFEYRNKLYTSLPVVMCGILMVPMITRLQKLPGNLPEFMYLVAGIYLAPLFIFLLQNFRVDERIPRFSIKHLYFFPCYIVSLWLLWHYSASLYSNKLFYSILPVFSLFVYLKQVKVVIKWTYNKLVAVFTALANISYPLYLLHMPLMYLTFHFLPGNKWIGMALAIVATLILSAIFEKYLFKKLAGRSSPPLVKKGKLIATKPEV